MGKTEKPALFYVGPNHIIGVPARDLSADDVERTGWSAEDIAASGAYTAEQPKGWKPEPDEPAPEPAEADDSATEGVADNG